MPYAQSVRAPPAYIRSRLVCVVTLPHPRD